MTDESTTLAGVIEAQAEEQRDRPYCYFEERVISFGELNSRVNQVANGLAGRGVKPGVGVAIMLPNSPEWLFVYFGIQKLGAYAVPVNVALKGEGLRHVIDHSGSRILICHPDYIGSIQKIEASLGTLENIVVDTTDAPGGLELPQGWTSLKQLMDSPDTNPGVEIDPRAISALMYTSGTTGLPKGVVNRYDILDIASIHQMGAMLQSDEMPYTCLPLFHANAIFLTSIRSLVLGYPMVLGRRFSARRFWDEMRRYGVTTFNALGAMIPILMKQPERDNDRDNRVRMVFSAACPGGGFMVSNTGNAPKGSFGKPTNRFRIIDDEGHNVPAGQSGELLFEVEDEELRQVEYYKNPESSNAKIRDGWFHTGDIVFADEEGNLYFVDRKTDSLRRRGENISSWEVEREINTHPAVLESAVFGVPSELGEDEVMAIVVLKSGATVTPEALIDYCEQHMAHFMVPRYLEFRETLPKTGTHRVQKGKLKLDGVGSRTWDREALPD
jgi:crotonobetaine/carnitine-CoA ligase